MQNKDQIEIECWGSNSTLRPTIYDRQTCGCLWI